MELSASSARFSRIRKLRLTAKAVLQEYDIAVSKLTFLSSTNPIFRVEDREKNTTQSNQYLLKFDTKLESMFVAYESIQPPVFHPP